MLSDIVCSIAQETDLADVLALQRKYHIASISEEEKGNGFVTTLFTRGQLLHLVKAEQGLFIARQHGVLIAYAMSASWDYWQQWPMFAHIMTTLHQLNFKGQQVNVHNSYQYGPVCIDEPARGSGVLEQIFDFARTKMQPRFPILITFINKINTRSYAAHTQKLGLSVIAEFEYNQQHYYELVCDTSRVLGLIHKI